MAAITVVQPTDGRPANAQAGDGQRGFKIWRGIGKFNGTDTSGTLNLPGCNSVRDVQLTPVDQPAGVIENIQLSLGTVSATAAFTFSFGKGGTVTAATVADKDAISGDDTNFWTFGIVNKGGAGSGTAKIIDSTVAANSTKVTGGSGLGSYAPRALTLGAAADLIVASGDVAELTITKTASAVTMTEMHLRVSINVGGNDEQLYPTVNSSGVVTLSSSAITINRSGNNRTSSGKFAFFVIGH